MARHLVIARLREPEWVTEIEQHLRAVAPASAAQEVWNHDAEPAVLTVASLVDVFRLRDAATQLEGGGGLTRTSPTSRFASLPLLPLSVWIPVELPAPRVPLYPTKIAPVGLASSSALLRELDTLEPLLRESSAPDPAIADVCAALRRGAELSLERRAPMMGFPADPPA